MQQFEDWLAGETPSVKDLVLEGFRAGLHFKSSTNNSMMRQGALFTMEMIDSHAIIDRFMASLQDEESWRVIAWLIRFRAALSIIGDKEVVLNSYFPSSISTERHAELVAEAENLPEARLERALAVDLIENFLLGGYSIPGICETLPGDTVLDLGVFNGNSTIDLARRTGPTGRVIGFEPNDTIAEIARANLAKMGVTAEIVNSAVGEAEGELRFHKGGAASRIDPNGEISVPVVTIDDYVGRADVDKVDFFKLDIEGHEVQALKGARGMVKKHKPKIAVCIYHLATDLTNIPTLISEFHPGYSFYVRHRARHDGEVVLFCVP